MSQRESSERTPRPVTLRDLNTSSGTGVITLRLRGRDVGAVEFYTCDSNDCLVGPAGFEPATSRV